MTSHKLIAAGALRQFKHNDGSEGFVPGYDIAITDREFYRLAREWISCKDRLPSDETPVLVVHNDEVKIGAVYWNDEGNWDSPPAFQYWDNPSSRGQCWEWDEVTHWIHIPSLPLIG